MSMRCSTLMSQLTFDVIESNLLALFSYCSYAIIEPSYLNGVDFFVVFRSPFSIACKYRTDGKRPIRLPTHTIHKKATTTTKTTYKRSTYLCSILRSELNISLPESIRRRWGFDRINRNDLKTDNANTIPYVNI